MSLMLPKSPRIELPRHLERVRDMRCLATGQTPCDPHHLLMGWNRKGEKPHDFWTIPLIHSEHMFLHDNKNGGEKWYLRNLLNKDDVLLRDVWRAYARSLYEDEMTA